MGNEIKMGFLEKGFGYHIRVQEDEWMRNRMPWCGKLELEE